MRLTITTIELLVSTILKVYSFQIYRCVNNAIKMFLCAPSRVCYLMAKNITLAIISSTYNIDDVNLISNINYGRSLYSLLALQR